jgi:hypothetical protein
MEQEEEQGYWSGPLPLDAEGFTVSFDINNFDSETVRQFYEEYGLVVFDNILTPQEIDLSIDDLWKEVESESHFGKIDRHDMNTWDHFEEQPYLHYYGFVGKKPFASGKQLWNNRANPNVYKAFKSLYELSSG